MKEFVAYIVKNLVDHPDKVKINEIGGTQTLIIELSVEKSDIGKIIGKKGKTINAIRTLLMSVASRNGIRVNLEILEEGGGKLKSNCLSAVSIFLPQDVQHGIFTLNFFHTKQAVFISRGNSLEVDCSFL